MRAFVIYIFFLPGFLFSVVAQENIDYYSLIQRLAKDFATPGVAVAVMDGYEFTEFTYGAANLDTQRPITNKTLFNVASISKLATAHAVMQLVDERIIDLDRPIEAYLTRWQFPQSSFNSNSVTTRMILNHSAGLSSEFGPGFLPEDSLFCLVDVLSGKSPQRQSLRIVYKPGTDYSYSNLGYGLLQLLIEEVTGISFEQYVDEVLFQKLGMHRSYFKDPYLLDDTVYLATPYNYMLAPYRQERFVVLAAAGLLSNLQDLEKLLLAETMDQDLLSRVALSLLHNTLVTPYGLGHIVTKYQDEVAFIGHTGLGMGWNSSFQFIPGSDQGIIVLTNGDNGLYVHETLTGYWHYTQTGKRLESCKVAPDKKLKGIAYFLELAVEKDFLKSEKYDAFTLMLSTCRKQLELDKFNDFVSQLTELQLLLNAEMKDMEIQENFKEAFDSIFYWMDKPWFK